MYTKILAFDCRICFVAFASFINSVYIFDMKFMARGKDSWRAPLTGAHETKLFAKVSVCLTRYILNLNSPLNKKFHISFRIWQSGNSAGPRPREGASVFYARAEHPRRLRPIRAREDRRHAPDYVPSSPPGATRSSKKQGNVFTVKKRKRLGRGWVLDEWGRKRARRTSESAGDTVRCRININ